MSKYIGITIGPVVKTIMLAGKTGELWGASYIFSQISKFLAEKIASYENFAIISPKIQVHDPQGVGTYPDRLFFSLTDIEYELIKSSVDQAIEDVYVEISRLISAPLGFVKSYFSVYYSLLETQETNPLSALNNQLDILELRPKGILREEDPQILYYLRNENIKKTEMYKATFGVKNDENHISKRFPNILEIGTGQWDGSKFRVTTKLESFNDVKNIEILNDSGKILKPLKYYALVRADGDAVGKTIAEANEMSNIEDISRGIAEFSKTATKEVAEYGGFMVYAGGDDLLFFAPVLVKKPDGSFDNILKLVKRINTLFAECFEHKLTISFGMTLAYNKFPLYETLAQSLNLLFGNAKHYSERKNALAVTLNTHSGNEATICLWFGGEAYKNLLLLIDKVLMNSNKEDSLRMSYQGVLYANSKLIKLIISDSERFKAWMNNNFIEELGKWHYEIVQAIILDLYAEKEGRGPNRTEETITDVLSILRLARFFGEKEEIADDL